MNGVVVVGVCGNGLGTDVVVRALTMLVRVWAGGTACVGSALAPIIEETDDDTLLLLLM
jgi:hypothetical protein